MPFAIPSLRDLVERARQSFRANLPGTDAWLWPNNIGPSAKVIGGMTAEVFGYADYIARQKFARTADGDGLNDHGAELGMARRAAAPASGAAVFTALTDTVVAAGAILSRSDGITYAVTVGGTVAAGDSAELAIVSELYTRSTIAFPGTSLQAISGVTGDCLIAVGTNGVTGGADVEDDESYRERILFRKRNVPQGGSAADYVIWASEVPGVTRVFVERLYAGPGTVRVFPIFDDDYPGGIAPAGLIATVRDFISTVQPAGGAVNVTGPAPAVIDVTIAGLTPNTADVRAAVLAELQSTFRRLGRVAGSNSVIASMPYLATPLSFSRSWLWQAAANAAGEQAHTITVPTNDVAIPIGSIPVLGTVTFI